MHIGEVKTAFKVADVVKNGTHLKNHIKFEYVADLRDENGNALDSAMLKKRIGFVYLLVVDGMIKKIGGSQAKGGIKATMGFYESAMQGGPSVRSYGIHLLIAEELKAGRRVELYVILSPEFRAPIKGLFGEHREAVSAFKEMEERCNEDFKSVTGTYPEWHFQSRGRGAGFRWPEWIRKSYAAYMGRT